MDPTITRAGPEDLAFVMATERRDGYDALVGRWDEARHRTALAGRDHAYFLATGDAGPAGFAIVGGWGSPDRVSYVKRIAVAEPGRGVGRRLLAAVIDAVFVETDAHRLWIGVFPDNRRARAAYRAVGFVEEGIARGSAFFGGVHRDELILAMLRPEWRTRRDVSTDGDRPATIVP